MNTLVRLYPGDSMAILSGTVVVQATVIVLAAWALARWWGRRNAAIAHALWLAALVLVLASPLAAWLAARGGLSLIEIPLSQDVSATDQIPAATSSLVTADEPRRGMQFENAPADEDAEDDLPEFAPVDEASAACSADTFRAIIGFAWTVWTAGGVLLGMRLGHGLWRTRRQQAKLTAVGVEAIGSIAQSVCRALNMPRMPPIATGPVIGSPMTVGVFRPLVVLPERSLRQLRPEELRDVLVHECAHAMRHDCAIGLLQRVAAVVFWPHPLVHLLNRELARAREELCDNYVLRQSTAPSYAETLLRIAESSSPMRLNQAVVGLFTHHWSLERRVAGLIDEQRQVTTRLSRAGRHAVIAGALAAAVALAGIRIGIASPEAALADDSPAAAQSKSEPAQVALSDQLAAAVSDSAADAGKKQPVDGNRSGGVRGVNPADRAVAKALNWLARHQMPDGSWSLQGFKTQCKGHPCDGEGTLGKHDAGATALGVLPFLGAGQTNRGNGPYQNAVGKALRWLMQHQKADGDLSADAPMPMYSHGLATIALCEAYAMTKDKKLGEASQRASRFIEAAQNPQTGGWRYHPGQNGDTSVTGWQVTALRSAELAGLAVDRKAFDGARRWLKSVATGQQGGRFRYMPYNEASPSMTAVGLHCLNVMGAGRDDPAVKESIRYVLENLPDNSHRDVYYWYAGTLGLHEVMGPEWDVWNHQLRKALIGSQVKEGCAEGSWDPQLPGADKWSHVGRLYTTSLSALCLEVYYLYLGIYRIPIQKPAHK